VLKDRGWDEKPYSQSKTLSRAGSWSEMRLGVLVNNDHAFSFWANSGYAVIEETKDAAGRPCRVMSKQIGP
jgi:hypothetical protein